ncbi:hypothetical protein HPSD74_1831 [Glaesserella parasuis D74]|nr:hypothetical protein HPSD74_1831 [Glaesserella parasuis D74]
MLWHGNLMPLAKQSNLSNNWHYRPRNPSCPTTAKLNPI